MDVMTKIAVAKHLVALLKTAMRVHQHDVENHLDMILDKKHSGHIRRMSEEAKKKSFSLRHPWLTGIPTLGLAPAIAHSNATSRIARDLLRRHGDLRGKHEKNHKERVAQLIEMRRADAPVNAARAIGSAAALSAAMMANRRTEHHEHTYKH